MAWPSGRRVGSTGPKHVRPQPLPGGGGQTFGCSEFGHQTTFHNVGRFVSHEANGSQLREITRLIEAGAIRPVVDRVFPFESTNEALA